MGETLDLSRYHRQMLLPGFGEAGQRRLAGSHALILGCGALGCTIADLLVRAGVGALTLVDRDVVEPTNLQRQTLFDEHDAAEGLPKAEAARRRLAAINSQVRVNAVVADFNHTNAPRIAGLSGDPAAPRERCAASGEAAAVDAGAANPPVRPPSVLLDGTDNFEARYLLNDLAVRHGIPYVYGGAIGTRGMSMTILPGRTPCLRCLFEQPPEPGTQPTCDTAGVLGPLVAMIGAYQASEALKIMLGREDLISRTLLEFDLWANQRRRVDLASARRDDCPACGLQRFDFLDGRLGSSTTALCGRDAVQLAPASAGAAFDLAALHARLAPHGTFTLTPFLVRGTLESERGDGDGPIALTVFADGRAIVRGTTRPQRARAVYARYVGG